MKYKLAKLEHFHLEFKIQCKSIDVTTCPCHGGKNMNRAMHVLLIVNIMFYSAACFVNFTADFSGDFTGNRNALGVGYQQALLVKSLKQDPCVIL